jgi:DNA-binding HxlR family transcriptional regulator
METITNEPGSAPAALSPNEALVREILERVADKWTLLVIDALEPGTATRFTRLRERIDGVSQKMLTKTLRRLERDGLVARRVYPEVPPRVDYHLTALGASLGEALCGVWEWAAAHGEKVESARREYDSRRHD